MLIFDMDGTLWNTVNATYKSANEVASKYDDLKSFSIDTIEKGMGLSSIENTKNYMPYLDVDKALYYLDKMLENTIKIISNEGADIYEGTIDTIKLLSKKYKLAIVTNSIDEYVEIFFDKTGLKEYFTSYIGAGTYNITKAEAIKRVVNMNKEENNYYIGDIKKDMEATIEAGITFIHAKYGFEPTLETKYYINSIKDLENLINTIEDTNV